MFVNVVASIQYRALAEKASDAFYKLSNTKEQIQAYVFDGISPIFYTFLSSLHHGCVMFKFLSFYFQISADYIVHQCFKINASECLVIRASVPKLELDSVFEQKNDIAKAVENELEKVIAVENLDNFVCNFHVNSTLRHFSSTGHDRIWVRDSSDAYC